MLSVSTDFDTVHSYVLRLILWWLDYCDFLNNFFGFLYFLTEYTVLYCHIVYSNLLCRITVLYYYCRFQLKKKKKKKHTCDLNTVTSFLFHFLLMTLKFQFYLYQTSYCCCWKVKAEHIFFFFQRAVELPVSVKKLTWTVWISAVSKQSRRTDVKFT